MAYQLRVGETPADGIRRILLEEIDFAVTELVAAPVGRHKAVHSARKTGKRIRAVLRLVRDELGEARFQQENTYFRDTSRLLAPVRDSFILVTALDALKRNFAAELPAAAFAGIRARVLERHETISSRLLDEQDVMSVAAARLNAARPRIAELPVTTTDFAAFAPGLTRVYRRGREAMATAYATSSPEAFHDWRKRVKYLWHEVEILSPLWPAYMFHLAEQLHQLSDFLGDAHDLHVLAEVAQEVAPADPDLPQLLALVARWEPDFTAAAAPLGARLYAEKPSAFAGRFAAYWPVAQSAPAAAEAPSLAAILAPTEVPGGEAAAAPATTSHDFVSTREAAGYLGLSVHHVRRLIRLQRLPARKVGNTWIIDFASLEQPTSTKR